MSCWKKQRNIDQTKRSPSSHQKVNYTYYFFLETKVARYCHSSSYVAGEILIGKDTFEA